METSDRRRRTDPAPQTLPAPPLDNSSFALFFDRWLPWIVTICLVLGVIRAVIEPFHGGAPWMIYEEDDFFYYLKIAQNLAHGSGSTFNGIVQTNGYHPLWLLVLSALSFFTTRPRMILLFLAFCNFTATLSTYFLARVLLLKAGAKPLISSALGAFVAIYALHLFTGGMEVILTIPLVLAVFVCLQSDGIWRRGFLQAISLGLLISAMVLSRLDTVLLAGLLFLAFLIQRRWRKEIQISQAIGIGLGLIPMALYFLLNRIWFGIWVPISGMAKQLKSNHLPSQPAIDSLLGRPPSQLLNLLPIVLAIFVLPFLYKRLTVGQKAVYPVAVLFPFAYVLLLSCLSDWKLWDWYFYSLRTALCVSFAILCIWTPASQILNRRWFGTIAACTITFMIFKTHLATGAQIQLYEIAQDVRTFASTHPGVYAMGDRSGMVAYLLPQPLIQTEGLVMDRVFLEEVKRQLPLKTVLAHYDVRYYIATTYEPYEAGCITAIEPKQAGPASPHLKSEFCEAPVAVFQQRDVSTLIFKLESTRPNAHVDSR